MFLTLKATPPRHAMSGSFRARYPMERWGPPRAAELHCRLLPPGCVFSPSPLPAGPVHDSPPGIAAASYPDSAVVEVSFTASCSFPALSYFCFFHFFTQLTIPGVGSVFNRVIGVFVFPTFNTQRRKPPSPVLTIRASQLDQRPSNPKQNKFSKPLPQ